MGRFLQHRGIVPFFTFELGIIRAWPAIAIAAALVSMGFGQGRFEYFHFPKQEGDEFGGTDNRHHLVGKNHQHDRLRGIIWNQFLKLVEFFPPCGSSWYSPIELSHLSSVS